MYVVYAYICAYVWEPVEARGQLMIIFLLLLCTLFSETVSSVDLELTDLARGRLASNRQRSACLQLSALGI